MTPRSNLGAALAVIVGILVVVHLGVQFAAGIAASWIRHRRRRVPPIKSRGTLRFHARAQRAGRDTPANDQRSS